MDIANLDVVKFANEGNILELTHPITGEVLTDEGEKIADKKNVKKYYLKMLGSDSDVYRNTLKRRFETNQSNKRKKIDLDVAQRKAAELLAKCTVECYFIENGAIVECTKEEMIRVYLKYPWIREQAEEFMSDRSNLQMS